jgi:adenylyl-sulfate kinase
LLARRQSRAEAGRPAKRDSRGQARLTPRSLTHQGFTLWFTGLSGAGKSTISAIIEKRLREAGAKIEVLDGDVVRENLSKGLGFSKGDRDINIRRIGFVCELLARNGVIAMVAAISPYRAVREEIRARIANFVEVYVECPLEVVAGRDVKGLYKKAIAGEIPQFTGVSDPYEPPLHPEVVVHSDTESPEESAQRVWAKLEELGLISF